MRKNYISILAAAAVVFLGCWSAAAQTATITGTVTMVKDGVETPVAGARVEAYRTDIKTKLPSSKTGKKGDFSFVGADYGGKFIISVSGEGITPAYIANVPAGADKVIIKVAPGDGKKFTEAEVRGFLTAPPPTTTTTTATGDNPAQDNNPDNNAKADKVELTAEQKKQQAEEAKQLQEAKEKNEKITNANVVTKKSLSEGRDALKAGNYDLAVTKFDEGINAAPDYAGSATILLNGKANALTNRGIVDYNDNLKITDVQAKIAGKEKYQKDFVEALDSYIRSWNLLKNAPASEISAQTANSIKMELWDNLAITLKKMSQTSTGDVSKLDGIKPILVDYYAAEKDTAKKAETQVYFADVYRLAGESEGAITEYRKALEMSPDNPDALAGIGLSLFSVGEEKKDTAQKQEGLNYLQRFVEVAPDNHPLKSNVADVVTYLKSQNLKPQKTSGGKKRN